MGTNRTGKYSVFPNSSEDNPLDAFTLYFYSNPLKMDQTEHWTETQFHKFCVKHEDIVIASYLLIHFNIHTHIYNIHPSL